MMMIKIMQWVVKISFETTRRIKKLFTPQVSFLDFNSLRLAGFIFFFAWEIESLSLQKMSLPKVFLFPLARKESSN